MFSRIERPSGSVPSTPEVPDQRRAEIAIAEGGREGKVPKTPENPWVVLYSS